MLPIMIEAGGCYDTADGTTRRVDWVGMKDGELYVNGRSRRPDDAPGTWPGMVFSSLRVFAALSVKRVVLS